MNKLSFLFVATLFVSFPAILFAKDKPAQVVNREAVCFDVHNYYKYRPDGKPGREVLMHYAGNKDLKDAKVEFCWKNGTETVAVPACRNDSALLLLPPDIGVSQTDTIGINLIFKAEKLSQQVIIPSMRHWTVYIYPHSHVDIGYTNTQKNVEFIHKRNLDIAMDLAKKTAHYPVDARFRWNSEVTWPVERYLHSESPGKCKKLIDAIRKGYISVDAGYVNTNTSASNDEELLQLFGFKKKLEKMTGQPMKTMVQVDVPGFSWGIVPAANRMGVSYILSLFNGYDRTGFSDELSFKPFWWIGPDGKSKVLFLQPGSYNPGALIKGRYFWPLLAGQTDSTKLLAVVKTDHPRQNFVDVYLNQKLPQLEKEKYAYDIFPMTWCMADNTPIDADLPEAVKSWNEEYAYPHLRICTGTEMMQAFEKKYGKDLPVLKGDYTEYWSDGLGASAKQTGAGRQVKERLLQTETLWSMLHPTQNEPTDTINEAWRQIILSTEHTWAYMQPDKEPISSDILKVKFGHFDKAAQLTDRVMADACQGVQDRQSSWLAVFNTNSWSQTGLVYVPKSLSDEYGSVVDSKGKTVLSQRLSNGELVFKATDVPALGNAMYQLKKEKNVFMTHLFPPNGLDNGTVKLTVDPATGDVNSIIYQGMQFVDQKALAAVNSFRYLKGGDTSGRASKPTNVHIVMKEKGPLVYSLLITSDAEGCNSLSREVVLTDGSPCIGFKDVVDKKPIVAKEGIHFGFAFDVPDGITRVNVPWGTMQLEKDQLKAGNRNWIAFERWLDVSDKQKGVTWSALNACMFESGDMTANIIGGALHSPQWIRKIEPSSTIYSWALNNHWHTNFPLSQKGKIEFQYRMLPHVMGYDAVQANRFGLEQCRPLIGIPVGKNFRQPNRLTLTGSDAVFVSMYKTVDKGKTSVIRFYSVSDKDETIVLHWANKMPKQIVYSENKECPRPEVVKDGRVQVPAKGLVTVRAIW